MAIIILEDNMAEEDETFDLIIEELGVATSIVILDDDGNYVKSEFLSCFIVHILIIINKAVQ